ncbi:hypothetical protein MUK42_32982 [Musa troglodytarum]|uniref:Uncharacterized protein n=1 Tax=Musa troglodytarum TaxID=320322 RepID=A0A9E7JSF1_9LILI|nr:hypothetical protein MUK42_32982 [Musa troglodytarum]
MTGSIAASSTGGSASSWFRTCDYNEYKQNSSGPTLLSTACCELVPECVKGVGRESGIAHSEGWCWGRTENEEETPTIASVEESERWGLFGSIKRGGEGSSAHQSILTPFAPFS